MEDEEGAECGKADFVLLDQVTMEDFMENLKLRWAQAGSLLPGPSGGGEGRGGRGWRWWWKGVRDTQPPRPPSGPGSLQGGLAARQD